MGRRTQIEEKGNGVKEGGKGGEGGGRGGGGRDGDGGGGVERFTRHHIFEEKRKKRSLLDEGRGGNGERKGRSGEGNRRPGRASVFYLNDVKGELPLGDRVVPLASTSPFPSPASYQDGGGGGGGSGGDGGGSANSEIPGIMASNLIPRLGDLSHFVKLLQIKQDDALAESNGFTAEMGNGCFVPRSPSALPLESPSVVEAESALGGDRHDHTSLVCCHRHGRAEPRPRMWPQRM
uniref:Uncharacterized protein n=1 Tax=Vespula pensylvanica TaxID=30213 RepID=A0A834U9R2_VESPE|nr:hypothetical protein H0235_009068 [Vespula pensylvanica]